MSTHRIKASVRKRWILEAAGRLCTENSYRHFTQSQLASAAGITRGLITYHFENMDNLRCELMAFAIETNDLNILAQGLALHDPIALAAPDTAKANALATLSNA